MRAGFALYDCGFNSGKIKRMCQQHSSWTIADDGDTSFDFLAHGFSQARTCILRANHERNDPAAYHDACQKPLGRDLDAAIWPSS